MTAAKALSCEASRADLRHRRITAVIAEKTDQRASRKKGPADGRPIAFDPERYRQRSTVFDGAARPGAQPPRPRFPVGQYLARS
ncbi:hypothetical protein ACWEU6_24395, partial [Streptosporangium sandarakinum]